MTVPVCGLRSRYVWYFLEETLLATRSTPAPPSLLCPCLAVRRRFFPARRANSTGTTQPPGYQHFHHPKLNLHSAALVCPSRLLQLGDAGPDTACPITGKALRAGRKNSPLVGAYRTAASHHPPQARRKPSRSHSELEQITSWGSQRDQSSLQSAPQPCGQSVLFARHRAALTPRARFCVACIPPALPAHHLQLTSPPAHAHPRGLIPLTVRPQSVRAALADSNWLFFQV